MDDAAGARARRRTSLEAVIADLAEERVLELVERARLPRPRTNVRVEGYEVDFFWPDHRLVAEVDGYA